MASIPQLRFSSTTPHFFKIILEDTSRHKLKIPKKFVMKYGKDLSSSVCLELPSGSKWDVELTRSNGKVWFEKGWPEFSMFCSLDYGSFLVFRYEGNSHFRVCIFDMSATEIDYPITMPKIEGDDLSIEILEDFQPSCPKTRRSPLPYPPYKKMRTSLSGKADILSESENTQPCCDMFQKPIMDEDSEGSELEVEKKYDRVNGGESGTQRYLKQTSHNVILGNAIALRRAYDLKTENPSFIVSMKPSEVLRSLVKSRYQSLPLKFAKRHIIKQSATNITLQVSEGRTWSVEFTYSEEEARFQGGWLTFVKDNNLEVGDVCLFILIKNIKPLLRVVIFCTSEATKLFLSCARDSFPKKEDGGSPSSSQKFLRQTPHQAPGRMKQSGVIEKASAFKFDKRPSFSIVMQPSCIKYSVVSIPNEFAKRYLMELPAGIAILKVLNGRTWSVKFKYDHANSRGRLLKGWWPFVRENNLKVSDVCVFTLVNSIQLSFEVAFFPTRGSANGTLSTGHGTGATVKDERTRSPLVEVEPECNLNCEIGVQNMSESRAQMPLSSFRTSRVNLEAAARTS